MAQRQDRDAKLLMTERLGVCLCDARKKTKGRKAEKNSVALDIYTRKGDSIWAFRNVEFPMKQATPLNPHLIEVGELVIV